MSNTLPLGNKGSVVAVYQNSFICHFHLTAQIIPQILICLLKLSYFVACPDTDSHNTDFFTRHLEEDGLDLAIYERGVG